MPNGPLSRTDVLSSQYRDDFAIDEHAGVAYITTHRENTIECVPLDPKAGQVCHPVAGVPFDERLIGPSAFAWGRGPEGNGSIAYVTTDGGFTAPPPDGVIRPAKVLRIELPHAEEATRASSSKP